MITSPRPVAFMITAVAAAALLAGCGNGAVPGTTALPAPLTTTPSPAPTPGPPPPTAPTTPPPTAHGEPAAQAALPWPPGDPAALQAAVDAGSQPWLLDPVELALSYVTAVQGWTGADATRSGTDAVLVRNQQGETLRVGVAQPGRTGSGGIWRVTTAVRA